MTCIVNYLSFVTDKAQNNIEYVVDFCGVSLFSCILTWCSLSVQPLCYILLLVLFVRIRSAMRWLESDKIMCVCVYWQKKIEQIHITNSYILWIDGYEKKQSSFRELSYFIWQRCWVENQTEKIWLYWIMLITLNKARENRPIHTKKKQHTCHWRWWYISRSRSMSISTEKIIIIN